MRAAALRAAVAFALVLAVPGSALAAPGDLDATFGSGGKVTVPNGLAVGTGDVVVQGDGKIVTVRSSQSFDFSVMRHNADGSLDTAFGAGGEARLDMDGGEDVAEGVALQNDGKIVVVGRHQETEDEFAGCCWLTVSRFNADGSVDTSFGGGDGWVSPGLAGGAEDAAGVAVQDDGKILAGAAAGGSFALVRYDTSGNPDTSFGDGDGVVFTSFSEEGGAVARDMVLQSNGKIVLAGYSGETSFDFALARYLPDGSLDTGFGGDGKVTTDLGGYNWGDSVAVQSTGKILMSGWSGEDFTLVRYNLAGTLDGGFGTGGVVTTDFGPSSTVYDLAVQPDDRILAAGAAGGDFALARYQADGTADTGFASGGRTTTDFGAYDTVGALALQTDGKIVAFGDTGEDRALARYLGGTGTPPPPPPTGVDLSVTKTGTGTVSIGDRATYTVTVTNNSATTNATGVTLTDALTGPAGTVISATPSQGTCTTAVSCALGTLAPGAKATVTVVAEPRATGTLTEKATVTATQTDPATANNSATVTTTVNNSRGCTRIGTSGNDTITGTYGTDVICGLSGDDTINASYGNDTAYGNYGNDRVDGGLNDDTLNGGPGNDNLIGNYGNDRLNTVDSVSGNDTANGGYGTDTCTTDTGDIRLSCP
ncbi:calcium-binding protein [Streptomyces sp. NPDC046909]|uniref:calcium-binding protein n=1 Tax=Streptomyces sp. NPDC046909 TaxID=3155617 RepID=UPI0033C3D790